MRGQPLRVGHAAAGGCAAAGVHDVPDGVRRVRVQPLARDLRRLERPEPARHAAEQYGAGLPAEAAGAAAKTAARKQAADIAQVAADAAKITHTLEAVHAGATSITFLLVLLRERKPKVTLII